MSKVRRRGLSGRNSSRCLRVSSISELRVAAPLDIKTDENIAKKLKKSNFNSDLLEYEIQKMILDWSEHQFYKGVSIRQLLHHSANGGYRTKTEAKRFKDMGVQAGYPDLVLNIAKGGYHGLFIELKRSDNENISEHQQWWLQWLNQEGHYAVVCKGFDSAVKTINDYLSGRIVRQATLNT